MKRSRAMSIVLAAGLAVILIGATGLTAHGAVKKPYTADVSPHNVTTGSTAEYTLTVTNMTLTQSLGSCNLTAPPGFTLGVVTQQPSVGTATIVGNVVQLRNLSTAPMTSRTARFTATAPTAAGSYTWGIECRQANNFSPDRPSNKFNLDAENSNLVTVVSGPVVNADLAITGHTDSPDPVVGSNTVQYDVTIANTGPSTSGTVTLSDSTSGGSITHSSGTGWTCSGTGSSTTCTHASLANGESASVRVLVTAPAADTTITNHAEVLQSGANDPDSSNNVSDESTTVNKDSTCDPGFISCGTGQITYNLPSQVTTGSTPTATRFLVGTTTFAATAVTGGQTWSMSAPAVPESVCPIDFTNTAVTRCDWQMNLDDIPAPYTVPGQVTFVGICHVDRCPEGVISGAGTVVVKVADDGSHEILPRCSGASDTRVCFEQERTALIGGHLRITVRNMTAGDPKVGGICLGRGC